MASLSTNRASTLADAYRVCDVKPLASHEIEHYYVPFPSRQAALIKLQNVLRRQERGEFATLLVTGHVGCGKTSELRRVATIWQQEYQVVFVNTEDETDTQDVEYTDLYLLIIKQIEYVLRREGLKFDAGLLASFEKWFKEITQESEETVERAVNVESEASLGLDAPFLAKLLVKLTAQIKGASKDKRTIREVLMRDVSRMRTDINLLLADGVKKLQAKFPEKKGFLVIFDGLDKCPRNVSERLFFDYAPQLKELHCTIIYTVPLGSLYTLRGISKAFDNPNVLPMTNVYRYDPDQLDLDHDSDGVELMAGLVERRVQVEAVFESRQQLLEMAEASGGNPRFLMYMMREACLLGDGLAHPKLQDNDILHGIKQLQFRFEREIPRKYYPVLVEIAKTKQLPEDEVSPELLFSTAVMEYNGEYQWYYPNPMVRRSELFKRALRDSTTSQPKPG